MNLKFTGKLTILNYIFLYLNFPISFQLSINTNTFTYY